MGYFISPKLDIVFKALFVSHKELLPSFLSAVLDVPESSLTEISIVNSELLPDKETGKYGRLDLSLKLNNQLIDIEMQVSTFPEYRKRCLFYWAKQFTGDIQQGEEYDTLKSAIAIHILNFNMFEDARYAREIRLKDTETGEIFSRDLGLYFLELPKVDGIRSGSPATDKKKLWMQFFKAETEEDFDMLSNTQVPEIKSAVNVILDMSQDALMRARIASREAELHDRATIQKHEKEKIRAAAEARGIAKGIAKGRAEGIAKGREKGMAKGRSEGEMMAKKDLVHALMKKGFSLTDALQLTQLDEATFNAIQE